MPTFSFSLRPLLLCLALAAPVLQAQQSPGSPDTANGAAPQADDAQCILAGRLNSEGRWAPRVGAMQMLDESGKLVQGASPSALSTIKAVRFAEPALLASCNSGQAMVDGDAGKGSKSPAPAVAAGRIPVQVLATAMLPGRAGGQWVELRLNVPADRLVALTR